MEESKLSTYDDISPPSRSHGPLHLPHFQNCYDDANGLYYLFHPRTGEVIYVDNPNYDASKSNRKYSSWTRPTEPFASIREMREDAKMMRGLEEMWKFVNSEEESRATRVPGDEEEAVLRIQCFLRRMIALVAVRRKIHVMFTKHYDESAFLYYFMNTRTRASQWHRPIGIGKGAEGDLPEMDFNNGALAILADKKGGEIEDEKEEKAIENLSTGRSSYREMEEELGFQITSARKKPFKYLGGPYCKRTKNKPGRNVTKALGNRKLKEAGKVVDEYGRTGFGHPSELDLSAPLYGPDIPSLDGLVLRQVPVEPYMMLRASHEHGPDTVMDKMEEYAKNRHMILFGMLSLSKMEIIETEDGVAPPQAVRCTKMCIEMAKEWEENMAILSAILGTMASLSDNYANRIMINEHKWMPMVVKLMKMVETETNDVYIRFSDGVRKVEVTNVSRHSIEMAINGCKFLSNMSCDEANREYVADSGFPLVTYAMKFCSEDPTVAHYGVLALYNFVYRNEPAHYQANEEGVLDLLDSVLDLHGGDDNLRKACKRCIAAMEPEGWRGNLAIKFDDSQL